MTKEDISALSFIEMTSEEQEAYVKGKSRSFLVKLALRCAQQAAAEIREKDNYESLLVRENEKLDALEAVHVRMLELSGKLEDEVNRLRNENGTLDDLVEAALDAHTKSAALQKMIIESKNAEIKLAMLGVEFALSEM